jgi:hypothetical protein
LTAWGGSEDKQGALSRKELHMHEISLGRTIRDYITGEELEETTYEEFRQGLARLLVEEKGYPRENVRPRITIGFTVDGKAWERVMDLGVFEGEKPLLLLIFCAGEVDTYVREAVAGARLHEPPFPLVLVTDTKEARLASVREGSILARGFYALPVWEKLLDLAGEHPAPKIEEAKRQQEERLFYAYSAYHSCCGTVCPPQE